MLNRVLVAALIGAAAVWGAPAALATAPAGEPPDPAGGIGCYDRAAEDVDGTWQFVSAGGFAVWFRRAEPALRSKASGLALALKQHIAPVLSFMKPALPDTNSPCSDGGTPDLLDFYLVPRGRFESPTIEGWAPPQERHSGPGWTGFVEIDEALSLKAIRHTAAHEYFHLLQFRYGNFEEDNDWWGEATATWASYFAYRGNDDVLGSGNHFQRNEARTAIAKTKGYGAYLWVLHLVTEEGGPGLVRRVWDRMGDDGLATDALGGLWKQQFPHFVLRQFNEGKVEHFTTWKAATEKGHKKYLDMHLEKNEAEKEESLPVRVEPGSGYLIWLGLNEFPIRDSVHARGLFMDLSAFTSKRGAHVKVLLQRTGQGFRDWEEVSEEDWSGLSKKYLCRDRSAEEDLQQIYIALSNANPDGPPIEADLKFRSRALCPWKVTLEGRQTGSPGAPTAGNYRSTYSIDLSPGARPRPIVCAAAKEACLPLVGTQDYRVSWIASESGTFSATDDPNSEDGRYSRSAQVIGGGRLDHVMQPSITELPPVAVFQDLEWDRDDEVFVPVLDLTLITDRSRSRAGVGQRFLAGTAHSEYHSESFTCGGDPDSGSLFVDHVNNHGLVTHTERGECIGDEDYTQGAQGEMRVGFESAAWYSLEPAPEALERLRGCRLSRLAPYDTTAGGLCLPIALEPHQAVHEGVLRFSGEMEPDAALNAHPERGSCEGGSQVPCQIYASDGGSGAWEMEYELRYRFEILEERE